MTIIVLLSQFFSWNQFHEKNDFKIKKEEIVVKYNEQSCILFPTIFGLCAVWKFIPKNQKKWNENFWFNLLKNKSPLVSVSYHQIQDLRRRIRKYFVVWEIRQFEFYFLQHQTKYILCTKQYCTEGAAIRAFLLQLVLVLKTQCTQISI